MIHNDDNDDDANDAANDNSSQDCWEREGRRTTKDAGWKTMIFSIYFRKLWYFQDIDAMMIFNPLIFSRYWWWFLVFWYFQDIDDDIWSFDIWLSLMMISRKCLLIILAIQRYWSIMIWNDDHQIMIKRMILIKWKVEMRKREQELLARIKASCF